MERALKILNIEDSSADFLLVERHLRQQGMNVTCVRVDTPEALQNALDDGMWDLILSDFSVPRLDFYDSFARIQSRRPDLPVILVSGSVGEEQAVELLKLGVWDFVLKDNLTRLVPAIEHALKESSERQARFAAEEALRESEHRFRTLFEASRDALMTISPETWHFTSANSATVEMFAAKDEAQFTALNVWMVSPEFQPDGYPSGEKSREMIEIALQNGFNSFEWRYKRLTGEEFAAEVHLTRIEIKGEVILQSSVRDVSLQQQAKEALQKSEARFRAVLDNAADAVFVAAPDGNFTYVNSQSVRMLGLDREELLARGISDIVPPHETAQARALFNHLKRSGHLLREINLLRRDGVVVPVELNAVALPDGSFFGACRDISARKQSEEMLRKLFVAVEQSPAVIVITNREGTIEYVNPRFTHMTGYSLNEVIGQNPRILRGDTPIEEYDRLWATICGGNTWEGDLHNRKKDGSLFWEHATIAPIRDDSGTISHFLAIKEDITEKRSLEEQLRQSQKMEVVGQLAGGVAHDYNNILQVIMGNTQLQSMYNQQHGVGGAHLDEIFKAVERGASLTRSLLVFCRKQPLEMAVFDLNGLVRESHKLAMRLVTEEISINLEPGDQLLNVRGDSSLVQNVVFNLVTNARDAISRQGSIAIGTRKVAITKDFIAAHGATSPEGCYALLSVTDSGCGIRDEIRDKIFEPFFTTKEVGKGTGLGLAMIYGTIRQMEGFIVVDSQPGAGTAIEIYIPLVDKSEAAPVVPEQSTGVFGNNELVLVVEDEEGVRNSLAQILAISDYRVMCAANGEDAIALAREHSPELKLVIMDMILPDRNGTEIARELNRVIPDLPVLFLSGYGEEHLELTGIIGCRLRKPVHPVELLKHVHRLLGKSGTQDGIMK